MDGDLKVGDVLTEAEIGRAWDLYMGCGDAGTFRARCMPGVVLPAVARLGEMPDRDGYAEKVFSALAYGLRISLKAAADGIRSEDASQGAGAA